MSIENLAASYLQYFEARTRLDGSDFKTLTDDRPDELYQLIYDAHNGMLPDDYKYDFIVEILQAIADTDDPEDIEIEASIYNHELLNWLASRIDRVEYIHQAVNDFGMPKEFDFMELVRWGQWQEKQEVLQSVLQSLESIESVKA